MPPPKNDVGLFEDLFGDARLDIVQRYGARLDIFLTVQKLGQRAVNAVRINLARFAAGIFFMKILVENLYADNFVLPSFRSDLLSRAQPPHCEASPLSAAAEGNSG